MSTHVFIKYFPCLIGCWRWCSADQSFEAFTSMCERVGNESAYTSKSKVIKSFIERGTSGHEFTGVCVVMCVWSCVSCAIMCH